MNDSESKKQESAGNRIFGQLPEEKRDEIIRAMENQSVAPGTVIFRQGDQADKYYIIQSGKVKVFREDADGLATELSVLGAGESFGEMALLTGEPRSATVEAMEQTRLMVLSKEQFERILEDSPAISRAFVKQLSVWLMRDDKIIAAEAQQLHHARRATWPDFLLVIGVSVILAIMFNKANPNGLPLSPEFPDRNAIPEIGAAEAMEETKKGEALILDAGPANFYEQKHIPGAINMPLPLFDIVYMMTLKGAEKKKRVIVYGGTISKLYDLELANKLLLRGHKEVRVLQGGMAAWETKGYPVKKGQK